MKYIIGKFNNTGVNKINVQTIIKEWNHLWFLSQYGTKFTIFKGVRKDSPLRQFKTEISTEQANELIEKLGLGALKSQMFRKAISWTKN